MLNGVDVSSWQADIDLSALPIDFAIMKATQGTNYVNPYCDGRVQQAKELGLKWGFYHFSNGGSPTDEADYFVDNCENYFGEGVPILDFEAEAVQAWQVLGVRRFMERVHERTGVWPIFYTYQNVIDNYDWTIVAANCGLWLASYPSVEHPDFSTDFGNFELRTGAWDCLAIWQFCSDGRIAGYGVDLDLNHAYMTREAWGAYARNESGEAAEAQAVEFENEKIKITLQFK